MSKVVRLGAFALLTSCLATGLAAQSFSLDRLQVHGFLTQAVAASSDIPIYGMQDKASTDFRVAALLFRYAMSDKGSFVLQLEHRRVGTSALNAANSDVSFNWGYYQHRFGQTSIKLGRFPMPAGIFTGIRDVGTILPFYRAPFSYYPDSYEALDGAQVGTRLPLGGGFTLAPELYGGGVNVKGVSAVPTFVSPTGQVAYTVRANDLLGTQVWLETPVQGLRVGGGARTADIDGQQYPSLSFMADAVFERFFVRGEFSSTTSEDADYHARAYYAQGGVHLTPKLSVNGQAEFQDTRTGPDWGNTLSDYAGGVTYAFTSGLVAKLEQHRVTGYGFDQFIAPGADRGKSWYTIASLSASF